MKIFLLYDYDDRVIKASCDGRKLSREADVMNGCDDTGEILYGPYFITDVELEDIPNLLKEK